MANKDAMEFLEEPIKMSNVDALDYQYFNQYLNHRTVLFNEAVTEDLLEKVILPLKEFEEDDSDEPVTLVLNTPGGSLFMGFCMCNIIDNYKKPLNIIVYGYSMSMGTIILCSGNKNPNVTKMCYPFSFFLHHLGEIALDGEAGSVKDTMLFNDKLNEQLNEYILKNTNITQEELTANLRKQWYFGADEAKRMGLIDKIIGCDD